VDDLASPPAEFHEAYFMMAFARWMCDCHPIIGDTIAKSLRHVKSNDVSSPVDKGLAVRGMSDASMPMPTPTPTLMLR
jgi:hypothetical protein